MASIKKNFTYNAIYQIVATISPLIITPYISRVLGPDNVGIYSYTYSIANYFMMFSMLGVKNYGNRSIAEVQQNKKELSHRFWNIYANQFLRSIILYVLFWLYIIFFI